MWAKTENICIIWKISISWKKCRKFFFSMPSHQTDIDGFKSNLSLLLCSPLEPMVINFTCDLSLVCIPPRWSPLVFLQRIDIWVYIILNGHRWHNGNFVILTEGRDVDTACEHDFSLRCGFSNTSGIQTLVIHGLMNHREEPTYHALHREIPTR